jgi:acetyl esterase
MFRLRALSIEDKPAPTFKNITYGPHERNGLDFWKADSTTPTPLVIFIHGGGFRGGSKENVNAHTLRQLLGAGISVAAINYRLISHAPLPAAHHDGRRALQFLRSKAKEWNLDKTRVGAFGVSAGAQICMWLAFHEDMADLESPDPIARESTRLACVAANDGQATMDVDWWKQWIPGYDTPHRDFYEIFGAQTQEEYLRKVAEVSVLSLVSQGAPPILMHYSMSPDDSVPADPQKAQAWWVHHVISGVKLKEKMDELGIEAQLNYPGTRMIYRSIPHFFIVKLL